ncbi:MAG: radical SAM protein, partial [Verrucomicrobia bacterium]|nr:radical SAM protein [Verrucomicrobiota bacterium]
MPRLDDAQRGRGADANPANRFERFAYETDGFCEPPESASQLPTRLYPDDTQSIIAYNQSPDVGFEASVNPYRGCEHGCIYCYARPTHEFLGCSAGLDFESKIFVKYRAAQLLARELQSSCWRPQPLTLSGVTDCYQPVEAKLKITRACLDVLLQFRNPVWIITKSRLVTRDADLLAELARFGAAGAVVSITTLDPALARAMEPRASSPAARLEAIARLRAAGIRVGIN